MLPRRGRRARRQAQAAVRVNDVDREDEVREEVRAAGRERLREEQPVIGRRSAGPPTARPRGFGASGARAGRSSRLRIEAVNAPETTKLTASTRIAYGAVTSPIRPPAAPGPATCAAETVS